MARNYKQGFFIPKNPQKYVGDISTIIYRSSWELKFFKWCDTNSNVLKWQSEEIIIPYISPLDNKIHRYFVDIRIVLKDKNGEIKTYLIEIKPLKQVQEPVKRKKQTKTYINEVLEYTKNKAKWDAAKKYAESKNWSFMIVTEKGVIKC